LYLHVALCLPRIDRDADDIEHIRNRMSQILNQEQDDTAKAGHTVVNARPSMAFPGYNLSEGDQAIIDALRLFPGSNDPGEFLWQSLMRPAGLNKGALSLELKVPHSRLSEILNQKPGTRARAISADTAIRLEGFFNIPADYFLLLQARLELRLYREQLLQARSMADGRTGADTSGLR
jgi:addiction module HigA family antidote